MIQRDKSRERKNAGEFGSLEVVQTKKCRTEHPLHSSQVSYCTYLVKPMTVSPFFSAWYTHSEAVNPDAPNTAIVFMHRAELLDAEEAGRNATPLLPPPRNDDRKARTVATCDWRNKSKSEQVARNLNMLGDRRDIIVATRSVKNEAEEQ